MDILSLSLTELEDFIAECGEKKYRAKQLYSWMMKGVPLCEMTNIPKSLTQIIEKNNLYFIPRIECKLVSKIDGTVKYLFEMSDGQMIESVVMKYEHGYSICVSCQCGCAMGCKFCASTIAGKARNLTAGEILSQIIAAQRDLSIRISNVVMMGIGEPLDNFDNTVKFLKLVSSPDGLNIGCRHISLSTCGIVSRISELALLDLPITLSISLHAYDDRTRSSIMPINNKWNIEKLLIACRDYFKVTGRRISFEYTLISGVNDSEYGAIRLAGLLKKNMGDIPVHVNLIPVNNVLERDFRPSDRKRAMRFCECLIENGVNSTIRRTLGSDINASCGQLRRKTNSDANRSETKE